jgi:tetratricopeptide (TPR) repeat protein
MLRALSASALILLAACRSGPDPNYARAFHEAERAQTAGRFLDAAQAFDAAATKAPNPRERAHAEYMAAKMYQRAGDNAEVGKRLSRMATETNEHAAKAAYDLALLRIQSGSEADGYRDLEAFLQRFSSSGLAPVALRHVAQHRDETEGKKATLAWLDALGPRLAPTELAETIAYQAARRADEMGDAEGAHARYLAIADRFPYPVGNTFDDSLFRASEIDEARGKPKEAIDHLERLLAERETASMLGTYQRPRYTPALLRVAELYRDRLGDRAKAREAFHRLYTDFTTSPFRDDALWQESELFRLDGDNGAACSRLSTLVSDFPDSRYVPCAAEKCDKVARPEKSKAPKTCHSYLLRSSKP